MFCTRCYGVLRGHQGAQWRGTYDLHFDHHRSYSLLKESANMKCCICRSLLTEIERIKPTISRLEEGHQLTIERAGDIVTYWTHAVGAWLGFFFTALTRSSQITSKCSVGPIVDVTLNEYSRSGRDATHDDQRHFLTAFLSGFEEGLQPIYRLDFRTSELDRVGTFILQKTNEENYTQLPTPFSHSTKSDEVVHLAKSWLKACTGSDHAECPNQALGSNWRPSRLVEIRGDGPNVRLVRSGEYSIPCRYVTLSHCWGKQPDFLCLTRESEGEFRKGIELKKLPRTFEEAIYFTRRLGVHYIWIDSLCIIQKDDDDWRRESAKMYEIYRHSYCNISATASANSREGLFREREPHELWENEVNLNIEGIPFWTRPVSSIQRCTVQDVSFWEQNIDHAPVNRRGWVLQERLLAPRVLHFCETQVAWECAALQAAESAPCGIPSLRLRAGDLVDDGMVKNLTARQQRVSGVQGKGIVAQNDAQSTSVPPANVFDHWRVIVEKYSKTELTKPSDKLIALSGIAKMISLQLDEKVGYSAGLWKHCLAGQLLWRVDPVFKNGEFYYPSIRPAYRAPTWSWAAIDAPQGVKYGDFADSGMRISVPVHRVRVEKVTDNPFGLVSGGSLELHGVLRRIELDAVMIGRANRYSWRLVDKFGRASSDFLTKHSIVYLDSPNSDTNICGPDGQLYCMLAKKESDGYLVCLLLQYKRRDPDLEVYRRVGLTRIAPYETGREGLEDKAGDNTYGNWNACEGTHKIRVE